ncbi:glutamate-gated chloride channel-like [Mercenaria mercenaria]|uniref:glutamate-gated chloride channel-like n=1 Tax=Mercenaria mercenaria TaxID=6596 RepID=UPI00234E99DA|nr:glutamate-gated chloride channel-like [Mercenaria mercenaria]
MEVVLGMNILSSVRRSSGGSESGIDGHASEHDNMQETLYLQSDNSGKDNKKKYVWMFLAHLLYIGIFNKEYEWTMYMRINWTDSRLNYAANNTNYKTLKLSSADVRKVWIPDLFFHHERHAEVHTLLRENVLVDIYEDGSIQYSVRVNMRSHCKMNLSKYPFDTQSCPVLIQSYAYTADYIILHWQGDPAVIIDNADHLSLEPGSTKSGFWSPYKALAGNYSTLFATILYKRASQSLDVMYVAPTIVFVGVSMSSFFFGDQLTSRIAVVTGSLTQIILQWAGLHGKLPLVSSLSRLDHWMLCNLVFVVVVLIANAVIYHTVIKTNKEEQEKSKQDSEKKREYEHLVRLTLICKIIATGKPDPSTESDSTAEDWKKKIKELAYPENPPDQNNPENPSDQNNHEHPSDQHNPENPPDQNDGGRQVTVSGRTTSPRALSTYVS